jgi:hypothetical protein
MLARSAAFALCRIAKTLPGTCKSFPGDVKYALSHFAARPTTTDATIPTRNYSSHTTFTHFQVSPLGFGGRCF